jgi:HlyD family secretion protein
MTVDLSKLKRSQDSPTDRSRLSPRYRWITRVVIPVAIVGGFVCLMLVTAGTHFLPRQSVTVLPVLVGESQATQSDVAIFQAAGWVEPRPQAIAIAALAPGVVDELLVVEGQLVEMDEPVARLHTKDAELILRQSKANLSLRQGELERCQAELRAAVSRFEQPVHLEVLLSDAQGLLARSRSELASLPFLTESAQSKEAFAKINLEGKLVAKDAISGRIVQQAQAEYATAKATLDELLQRRPFLQREVDALESKVAGVETQLRLLIEEKRQLEEARAKVNSATAIVEEAQIQVEQAELNLNRMVVTAPHCGRILRVIVSRGARVMGLEANASQSSSTIAFMYDPSKLQVRADVRLEDVPKLRNGQRVEIKTASAPEVIQGRVLQATSSANIQKNTLEVKVELIEPPVNVTPEMLVTATFYSLASAETTPSTKSAVRMLVPKQLINTGDTGNFVWTVDERQRAIRKTIALGNPSSGELSEVVSGLNLTDKLIVQGREALTEGLPLKIMGEDTTLGVAR